MFLPFHDIPCFQHLFWRGDEVTTFRKNKPVLASRHLLLSYHAVCCAFEERIDIIVPAWCSWYLYAGRCGQLVFVLYRTVPYGVMSLYPDHEMGQHGIQV